MAYQRRIVDDVLDNLFPHLAAIALKGAKGVGKTATASQRATTILTLNEPRQREVLAGNPDYVVQATPPVLIDEWQLEPSVWDRVRRAVDDNNAGGQFLLAGSAGIRPGVRIHSGAGRIVSFPMRPLAFSERGLSEPTVSLRTLLQGGRPKITGRTSVGLPAYADEILRSGFPGIRELPERARRVQLDSYVARIAERELPENGVAVRRPNALKSWLAAYGAATATDASYSTILDAATAGEDDKPARATADSYREHLQRIFVLDPIPAWIPTFNTLKRLTHAPKHHLVDPAIAARLVGMGKTGLLRGEGSRVSAQTGTWLGALFESLAAQSVRVYAGATDAEVGHLRTKNTDHEVDLIVEGEDRQVVAVEVKLAATITDKDVRHLNWLHDQIGDRLVDRVIITTGEFAYRRPDGVAVVPLALLGP
jgi:predicted AAA+ superfamily ATPase